MSLVMPQIVVWMLIQKYLNIGTGDADTIATHVIIITDITITDMDTDLVEHLVREIGSGSGSFWVLFSSVSSAAALSERVSLHNDGKGIDDR
jgi:hypothetical protein